MRIEGQDLLWLLLPLAAASGWYAAYRDQRKRPPTKGGGLSQDYFRGINYLLNEQPDKAIELRPGPYARRASPRRRRWGRRAG